MRIIQLTAENVKKLTAIQITPKGAMVEITGKNGEGKTSVLDCIWWALEGAKHIQAQPIRKGQKKARIRLELGTETTELIIERRFTEKGGSIIAENADGLRHPSPQTLLNGLIGALSFDPLSFTRMKPEAQFDALRKAVRLDVEALDKLDRLNKSDFSKRTDLNRDARAKRSQAEAITVPPDLPAEPVNVRALMDQLEAAGRQNSERGERLSNRTAAADRVKTLREEADELRQAADEKAAKADEIQAKLDSAPALPEPIDVTALRQEIDAATRINEGITKREMRTRAEQEATDLEAQAKNLTDAMDGRDQAKAEMIKAAPVPVKGLGFGDGFVTLDDVPLEQASAAQKLKVSMAIAMAANPKLRVIRIEDGSLLDEDSLAEVAAMAEANDFQVWCERVDSSGKIGFVIEDGHVKGQEVAEEATS